MKTEIRKNEGDVVRSLLDGLFYRVLSASTESVSAVPVKEEETGGKRVFTETSADAIEVDREVFDALWILFCRKHGQNI